LDCKIILVFLLLNLTAMKKYILTIACMLSSLVMFAQQGEVLTVAEQMPVFPGGEAGLNDYLQKNIQYPDDAKQSATEGTCFVTFVVSSTGEVTGAQILRGAAESLNREALRVVNAMPKWQPAMQSGEAVSVKFTLPVRFSLTVPPDKDKKNKK